MMIARGRRRRPASSAAGRYNDAEERAEQGACNMVLAPHPAIDYDAYVALALAHPDRRLEIHDGRMRQKPGMSMDHNRDQSRLVWQLNRQLDLHDYEVRDNSARLRAPSGAVYVPDVAVLPTALVDALDGRDRTLETYDSSVPFVVEVWSPSTGDYDVDTKFAEYRARGDAEIWRVHPFERTVIAWRRQAHGAYRESRHTSGRLTLWDLPNVTIDLDALFARR
jgi:Uma2 family endonuclease